jgi:hypothetical protein
MEQVYQKHSRPRVSKDQMQNLLREFEVSSSTVKDFCSLHKINRTTFHNWKSRYKVKANDKKQSSSFVTVEVGPTSSRSSSLFAEVGRIKIYQPVSAAFLKELSA